MDKATEDVKEVVSYLVKTCQSEVRPWKEFGEAFNLPKNKRDHIENRIFINLYYYRVNYLYCALPALLFAMFLRPAMMVVTAAMLAGFIGSFLLKRKRLVVGGKLVTHREKSMFLGILAFVLLLVTQTVLVSLGLTLVVACGVLAHAFMRPRSIRSKFSKLGGSGNVHTLLAEGEVDEMDALEGGRRESTTSQDSTGSRSHQNEAYARRREQVRSRQASIPMIDPRSAMLNREKSNSFSGPSESSYTGSPVLSSVPAHSGGTAIPLPHGGKAE